MFDISWGEFLIIGAVALIVIGPKDLPKALRTVGNSVGKLRRMAGEFQTQFNDAMREAELDEVRKQMQGLNDSVASAAATSFNPIETIRNEIKGAIETKSSPADAPAGDAAPPASFETPPLDLAPPPADPAPLDLAPPPVESAASEPAKSGSAAS